MSNQTEVQEASELRVYEVGYHIVPKVAEGSVPAEADRIKQVLAAHGASVIAEENPRMIQLSYEMAKAAAGRREYFSQAYFGWVKFEADPSQIGGIEEEVNRIPTVLRSIVISTVRESTMSKKVFVSDRPMGETIKKPEMAKDGGAKLSEAEIESAVDTLVADTALESEATASAPESEVKTEA
jgi:ribosomal protein S6